MVQMNEQELAKKIGEIECSGDMWYEQFKSAMDGMVERGEILEYEPLILQLRKGKVITACTMVDGLTWMFCYSMTEGGSVLSGVIDRTLTTCNDEKVKKHAL